SVDCYDMIWAKPLDLDLLEKISKQYDAVISLEDGIKNGGFGSAVADALLEKGYGKPIVKLGVPDEWMYHAKVSELHEKCGIDVEGIKRSVLDLVSKGIGK
ncbi:MAG: 1-deoxy-D-xylulose-5-phosphate synthase, partial [Muribaculaceae bacterium]|nr:1-deoxy-D-xylulose-5-phosphate synthase [Muribaculaceae bacterium]